MAKAVHLGRRVLPRKTREAELTTLPASRPNPPASVARRPVLKVPSAKLECITLLKRIIADPSSIIDPIHTKAPPRKKSHMGLPLQMHRADPKPIAAGSTTEKRRSLMVLDALQTAKFRGMRVKPYAARVSPDCDDDQPYSLMVKTDRLLKKPC
ncbi:hypothetical protein WJX77_012560 [Trebouxia sp. C0004]